MLKYVGDFHVFFRQKDGTERDNSWEVSNLGAIKGAVDNGGWKLTRAVFCQSAMAVGTGFGVNVAGIADGEITVTISWNGSIVKPALIDGLLADLEHLVLAIGSSTSL